MVVLPMYTSGGKGLKHKSDTYKRTAMSVLSPARPGEWCSHEARLYVDHSGGGWDPGVGSYVSLAEPYHVSYKWPLDYRGKLDPSSRKLLVRKYESCVKMGFQEVYHQQDWWLAQCGKDQRWIEDEVEEERRLRERCYKRSRRDSDSDCSTRSYSRDR